jgi:hypothetical protein
MLKEDKAAILGAMYSSSGSPQNYYAEMVFSAIERLRKRNGADGEGNAMLGALRELSLSGGNIEKMDGIIDDESLGRIRANVINGFLFALTNGEPKVRLEARDILGKMGGEVEIFVLERIAARERNGIGDAAREAIDMIRKRQKDGALQSPVQLKRKVPNQAGRARQKKTVFR